MRCDPTELHPTRDVGFTMVELVISLTVMSIGVLGAISVFNSSFSVAGAASVRSRAVALATSEIEAYRAVPYAEVATDVETTVESQQVAGIGFIIERGVTSADEESVEAAYKQVTVAISWKDHAGAHTVVQSTLLYPGGLGPHRGTTETTLEAGAGQSPAPQTPLSATATVVADAAVAEPAVDLAWTAIDDSNLAGFGVRYVVGSSLVVVTESLPPGSRSFRVSGLSSETTYTFQVGARSLAGGSWAWARTDPVTTAPAATATCSIGSPGIDPSTVERRPAGHGGTLLVNPTFSVNTSGSCPGLRMSYQPTRHAAAVTKPLAGSSGLRTGALEDLPAKWDSGTHLVDLYDDDGVLRATVKLLVCDRASACR